MNHEWLQTIASIRGPQENCLLGGLASGLLHVRQMAKPTFLNVLNVNVSLDAYALDEASLDSVVGARDYAAHRAERLCDPFGMYTTVLGTTTAGFLGGAAVGTAVEPGVGTLVGAAVGGGGGLVSSALLSAGACLGALYLDRRDAAATPPDHSNDEWVRLHTAQAPDRADDFTPAAVDTSMREVDTSTPAIDTSTPVIDTSTPVIDTSTPAIDTPPEQGPQIQPM